MIDLRPQLRSHLQIVHDPDDSRHRYLIDRLRQSPEPVRLSLQEVYWLQWFDGQRSLRDVQSLAMRQAGGRLLTMNGFVDLRDRSRELGEGTRRVYELVRAHAPRPAPGEPPLADLGPLEEALAEAGSDPERRA